MHVHGTQNGLHAAFFDDHEGHVGVFSTGAESLDGTALLVDVVIVLFHSADYEGNANWLARRWLVPRDLRPDRARLQAGRRRKVARVHAESDLTPGQIIGSMLSTAPAIHILTSFRAVLLLCVLSPGRDPRASPSQTCREFGCLRMKNYIETIVL